MSNDKAVSKWIVNRAKRIARDAAQKAGTGKNGKTPRGYARAVRRAEKFAGKRAAFLPL